MPNSAQQGDSREFWVLGHEIRRNKRKTVEEVSYLTSELGRNPAIFINIDELFTQEIPHSTRVQDNFKSFFSNPESNCR